MSATTQCVLFQFGSDPMNFQFEDSQERVAFTLAKVIQVPNVIVQLTRHDEWTSQHPDIMGPRNAFLYFGPSNSPGQVAYGNGQRVPMPYYLRKKKDGSNSRYFNAQGGKEFKWKSVSSQRMELCDSLNVYAVWEKAPPGLEHDAQVTLSATSLAFVTEVLTTLTLNLVAKQLDFW
ncbi:hypothetical protein ACEPAH_5366 [Sanghuangporus vaninii]